MKALEMCINTKKLLDSRGRLQGYVHSVFNRVCNIVTKDELLIPVISSHVPNTPRFISLSLPIKNSIKSLGLKEGMEIVFEHNLLRSLEGSFSLDLSEAKIWDARPIFNIDGMAEFKLLNNLEILYKTLIKCGKLNGIAPICQALSAELVSDSRHGFQMVSNHYSSFILPRMGKLIAAFKAENMDLVRSYAKQIVGFGPGLTPSADDFLTGFMAASLYMANYHGRPLEAVYRLNSGIVVEAEFRTTKVSSEMLTFAAKGEVSENVRSMLLALFSESSEEILVNTIHSVINNGETSGSDLIAGAYIGCILSI